MKDEVKAIGHMNVLALHKTTLEWTRETHLTPRGDCIIAVDADKSIGDIDEEVLNALKKPDTKIKLIITCDGLSDTVTAYGHPNLSFTHPTDTVVRKSDFTCSRTFAVNADKGSVDLDRDLIGALKKGLPVLIELSIVK